jgi:RHS repeat-associated protein
LPSASRGYALQAGVKASAHTLINRYYSSTQGRFTSVDPENAGSYSGNPQTWNGYSYALNQPMLYSDEMRAVPEVHPGYPDCWDYLPSRLRSQEVAWISAAGQQQDERITRETREAIKNSPALQELNTLCTEEIPQPNGFVLRLEICQ